MIWWAILESYHYEGNILYKKLRYTELKKFEAELLISMALERKKVTWKRRFLRKEGKYSKDWKEHVLTKSVEFLDNLMVIYKVLNWIYFATDSTKINRPGHNIRMYWTNFRQPTAHVQLNIFGKTPVEDSIPHLYASIRFFQKCCVVHEQSAVKNSVSAYVCYAPDGLFWLNLYMY